MAQFLRICIHCKKIYEKRTIGYKKSDIESHGICPDCFQIELKKLKGEKVE